jgi:hypothetical protein
MNLKEVITILISRFQKKDIDFLVGEGSKEAIHDVFRIVQQRGSIG